MFSARRRYRRVLYFHNIVKKIQRRVRIFLCSSKLKQRRRLRLRQAHLKLEKEKRMEELVAKRKAELHRKVELAKNQKEYASQLSSVYRKIGESSNSPSKQYNDPAESNVLVQKRRMDSNWALQQYENMNFTSLKGKLKPVGTANLGNSVRATEQSANKMKLSPSPYSSYSPYAPNKSLKQELTTSAKNFFPSKNHR